MADSGSSCFSSHRSMRVGRRSVLWVRASIVSPLLYPAAGQRRKNGSSDAMMGSRSRGKVKGFRSAIRKRLILSRLDKSTSGRIRMDPSCSFRGSTATVRESRDFGICLHGIRLKAGQFLANPQKNQPPIASYVPRREKIGACGGVVGCWETPVAAALLIQLVRLCPA